MKIQYDDQEALDHSTEVPKKAAQSQRALAENYLRLSSLMPSALRFALTGVFFLLLFCTWEKFAPREFTISYLIGRMEKEVSLAFHEGQMEAKAHYEAYFKSLEGGTLQAVEKLKANAMMVAENYRATYQLAQTNAAAIAEMQKQLAQAKLQMMARMSSGDATIVTVARFVEVFAAMTQNEQLARAARQLVQSTKQQVIESFDLITRLMSPVSVQGWNASLKSPAEVEQALDVFTIFELQSFEEFSKEERNE